MEIIDDEILEGAIDFIERNPENPRAGHDTPHRRFDTIPFAASACHG